MKANDRIMGHRLTIQATHDMYTDLFMNLPVQICFHYRSYHAWDKNDCIDGRILQATSHDSCDPREFSDPFDLPWLVPRCQLYRYLKLRETKLMSSKTRM